MKRFVALLAVLLVGLCSLAAAQNRTYTIEDLLKVRRVGDPQVSPDGKHVAFTIGDVNFNGNRVVNQIYVTSIHGGNAKQLTSGIVRHRRLAGRPTERRSRSRPAARSG